MQPDVTDVLCETNGKGGEGLDVKGTKLADDCAIYAQPCLSLFI